MNSTGWILAALDIELGYLLDSVRIHEPGRWGKVRFWRAEYQGQPLLIVRTGVGRARSARALQTCLEHERPAWLISTGYAGGLKPNLPVGTLILGDSVGLYDADAAAFERSRRPSDARLLTHAAQILAQKKRAYVRGISLTSAVALAGVADKQRAGEMTGASAVEMESWDIATIAAGAGIPFLYLRGISDSLEQPLDLTLAQSFITGRKGRWPSLMTALTSPLRAVAALRLLWACRMTSRRLCQALLILIAKFKEQPM
jgi:adenosylhomocysteine nucleosidase